MAIIINGGIKVNQCKYNYNVITNFTDMLLLAITTETIAVDLPVYKILLLSLN